MTDWNYADVWETVADVQPDAIAVTQGSRNVTWREFDRGADGIAQFLLDLGVAQQDKVAIYLYNSPEYLQTIFGRHQDRPRPGQHQLPLRRRRAELPVGQRRRRGGRLPRRRSPSASRGFSTACPTVKALALGRRRHRARARTGPRRTSDAAKSAADRTRRAAGVAAATTSTCSTPAARPACPRASCGARTTSSPGSSTGGVRHYPVDGGLDAVRADARRPAPAAITLMPACPLMHGTGGFTANTTLAEGGRRLPAREPQATTPSSCSTRSSARRSTPSSSWATPSPARCSTALDEPARAGGT